MGWRKTCQYLWTDKVDQIQQLPKKNGREKGGKESKTTDCCIVSEVGSKGCCSQKTGSKRLREKGLRTLEKL